MDWLKISLIAAGAAALIWLYVEIRDQGADAVRNAVERQNNAAGSTADDARSACDRCLDGGGVWDSGAGRCNGVAPRRGD